MKVSLVTPRGTRMTLLPSIVSLSGAPLRTCQTLRHCCLCTKDITIGQQYRDRGFQRRAHEPCVQEAALKIKQAGEDEAAWKGGNQMDQEKPEQPEKPEKPEKPDKPEKPQH